LKTGHRKTGGRQLEMAYNAGWMAEKNSEDSVKWDASWCYRYERGDDLDSIPLVAQKKINIKDAEEVKEDVNEASRKEEVVR
jgi:hypothetical protein